MMIRYTCNDMGLKCHFMVKSESLAEVTQKALEHILEKHSDDFNPILSLAQKEEMQKTLARSTRIVAG